MKNKYYAIINGEEVLVRTSTHNHYRYASLEANTFASTKDEVLKRIRSWSNSGLRDIHKEFEIYRYIKLWDCEKHCTYKIYGDEAKKYIEERERKANQRYNDLASKVIEVYIKG